jgi:hypothetical protein
LILPAILSIEQVKVHVWLVFDKDKKSCLNNVHSQFLVVSMIAIYHIPSFMSKSALPNFELLVIVEERTSELVHGTSTGNSRAIISPIISGLSIHFEVGWESKEPMIRHISPRTVFATRPDVKPGSVRREARRPMNSSWSAVVMMDVIAMRNISSSLQTSPSRQARQPLGDMFRAQCDELMIAQPARCAASSLSTHLQTASGSGASSSSSARRSASISSSSGRNAPGEWQSLIRTVSLVSLCASTHDLLPTLAALKPRTAIAQLLWKDASAPPLRTPKLRQCCLNFGDQPRKERYTHLSNPPEDKPAKI